MPKSSKKKIFLDFASITPVDRKVLKEVDLASKKFWANPSSLHSSGEEAKSAMEDARKRVAQILHSKKEEIVFTASGTEALNLGVFGVVREARKKIQIPHIIVSAIEHSALLMPIKSMIQKGEVEVSFISPNHEGIVSSDSVTKEIRQDTVLVLVQHANNEIGTIQPVRKIASSIRDFKQKNNSEYPYLLVDASQSFLYEDVSLERLQADLLVLDSIKTYGPRGIGLLALRSKVKIEPIMFGGGQERGLRPGTENVPAILGFAKSLEIAVLLREKESARLKKIRDFAILKILNEIPGTSLNGSMGERLPNNINICFVPKNETDAVYFSELLVVKLDVLGFEVSATSACRSLSSESFSYVVESLGSGCASSSLRFTLGRETKKPDLDALVSALKKIL